MIQNLLDEVLKRIKLCEQVVHQGINVSAYDCTAQKKRVSHISNTLHNAYDSCDLLGVRTQDPNIKSVVLYQLS